MPTDTRGPYDGDNSSAEAPSTQVTLVCVKLLAKKSHDNNDQRYPMGAIPSHSTQRQAGSSSLDEKPT